MNLDLDRALAVARNAALAAGEVIDHYYARGVAVRIKADTTPVTQADEDSEKVIREVLSAAYPDHAIYGEEGGHSGSGDYLLTAKRNQPTLLANIQKKVTAPRADFPPCAAHADASPHPREEQRT